LAISEGLAAVVQARMHVSGIMGKLLQAALGEYLGSVAAWLAGKLVDAALTDWRREDPTGDRMI
jgi:hypothetical protein